MTTTTFSDSPAALVAIARAAHLANDTELKRAALRELKERFEMTIRFGKGGAK